MKRGEGETRQRLDAMLKADKAEMNEESFRAAQEEFSRVAHEYFEPEGEVTLSLGEGTGTIEVTVRFRAVRVKNFYTLK